MSSWCNFGLETLRCCDRGQICRPSVLIWMNDMFEVCHRDIDSLVRIETRGTYSLYPDHHPSFPSVLAQNSHHARLPSGRQAIKFSCSGFGSGKESREMATAKWERLSQFLPFIFGLDVWGVRFLPRPSVNTGGARCTIFRYRVTYPKVPSFSRRF